MSVSTSECFEKQWDNTWLIMPSFTFPHCAFVTLSRNLVLLESLVSRATISLWPQQQTKGSMVNVWKRSAAAATRVQCWRMTLIKHTHNPPLCSCFSLTVLIPRLSNGPRVAACQMMILQRCQSLLLHCLCLYYQNSCMATWSSFNSIPQSFSPCASVLVHFLQLKDNFFSFHNKMYLCGRVTPQLPYLVMSYTRRAPAAPR